MRYFLITCFVFLAAGCTTTNVVQDIKPSGEVSFSTLEAKFPVKKNPGGDLKIKLHASRASKVSNQNLPTGKEIELGNQTIYGPMKLNLDTDLTLFSIGIGGEPKLSGEGSGNWSGIVYYGISHTAINLTVDYQGGRYDLDRTNTELFFQLGISYKVSSALGIEALYQAGSGGIVCCFYDNSELRLRYHLFNHLEIMAGYRWFDYDYYKPNTDTDLEISFRGPFAGLYVPF